MANINYSLSVLKRRIGRLNISRVNWRQENILQYFMTVWYLLTNVTLFFRITLLTHTHEPESLWIRQWTCRIWDYDLPAHETPWPFHPIILRPRWTCHMWHAPRFLEENPQVLFILSWGFLLSQLEWLTHHPKQFLCSAAGVLGLSLSHLLLTLEGEPPTHPRPAGRPEIVCRKNSQCSSN